jgi:signal transduction histidine kinase/CheY-like chemotaxis protein
MNYPSTIDTYENILLHTVNDIASLLIRSEFDQFNKDMQKSMEILTKAVEVDRLKLWKNYVYNEELYCSRFNEWVSPAVVLAQVKPAASVLQISYRRSIPEWEPHLSSGQCIKGLVREMPDAKKRYFESEGIHSVLVIPVFLEEFFWGLAEFDDYHRDKDFSLTEESILRSGVQIIVSAIQRNETTARLIQAREDALSASGAKSNFLSNMSHDIRTPIDAIIGMTSIGKAADNIERKNYALERIENVSVYLLGIINNVLDMSKIETKQFELAPAEFEFEKMIQEAVEVIRFNVEEKHQKFTVSVDKKIPQYLFGDDQRLAQVIANLLSNAVKFTGEEGDITLNAKLTRIDKDKNYITMEIIDTGIGINAEQQERIFNSFVRAESPLSRKHSETGLNLVISKRIIEMMNGRLKIESKPGKGTTFSFTVELKKGNAKDIKEKNATEEKIRNVFDGRSVLIVEDIALNREILTALLEPTGIHICCAENGREAIQIYTKDPRQFDLILMDINMPEMDGYETTRWIRSFEQSFEAENKEKLFIPIIALTAKVFREDIEKCFETGMNNHIGKPIDTEELYEKIKKYLAEAAI